MLRVQSSAAGGLKASVQFSAAGAVGSFFLGSGQGTDSGVVTNIFSLGTGGSTSVATTDNSDRVIKIWGFVAVGANSGNITTQIHKDSSGTATVYIGSRMTVAS